MDRLAEATRLARTYVWWEEPEATLAEPRRLTMAWFKDGDLESVLPQHVRDTLTRTAAAYDPRTPPARLLSPRLD